MERMRDRITRRRNKEEEEEEEEEEHSGSVTNSPKKYQIFLLSWIRVGFSVWFDSVRIYNRNQRNKPMGLI